MLSSAGILANQAALLEWVSTLVDALGRSRINNYPQANSMLPLAPQDTGFRVKKAEQLYDGAVFSLLLEILDDEYNPSRLQQALANPPEDNDDQRSRNLHIIHMALNDHARRRCPKIEPLVRSVDFHALGRHPTKKGMAEVNNNNNTSSNSSGANPALAKKHLAKIMTQILTVFLCACVWNEDENERSRLVMLIMGLDQIHQSAIFTIIKDAENLANQDLEATDNENEASAVSTNADDDLAREAELAHWRNEAEEAKSRASRLKMRIDRLQDSYDELLEKHEDVLAQNSELEKQIESELGNFDKHRLQHQLRENETLIANLENQRNDLIEQKERLEREKARLEVQVQKAEHLIDENQELRSKNEELSKKANTADNLRKKVEAYRPMEVELKALQNEKVDVMKAYSELEKANARIGVMRQEQEAYATKMEGYEIDIASFRDEKTMWKTENNELRMRIQHLEQQSMSDEQTVRDLQDKIQMLDPSARPDTPSAARPLQSLEDELRDSGGSNISMRDIEVQRLQAENALLRNSIGTETEKGLLLQELEDSRSTRQSLQERYNELLEKYAVGQSQIDALVLNLGPEGLVVAIDVCHKLDPDLKWLMSDFIRSEAYSNLRTQVLAEQNISKDLRRQLEAAKQALSDKERELLQARGDCKIILADLLLNSNSGDDADDVDDDKVNAVEKSSYDALEELKKTDGMIAVSLRAELDAERKKSRSLKDEVDNFQKQLLTAFIEKDQLRQETEKSNQKLQEALDGQTPSTEHIKTGEKLEKLRAKAKELKEVSASSLVVDTSAPPVISVDDSPISDWSDSDSDSDGDGNGDEPDDLYESEDEEAAELEQNLADLRVETKRTSMLQALGGYFRSPEVPQRPKSGFHPYTVNENGSFGFPPRPVSAAPALGGSTTYGGSLPSSPSGSEGTTRTSFESVPISPVATTVKSRATQASPAPSHRSKASLSAWFGIRGQDPNSGIARELSSSSTKAKQ